MIEITFRGEDYTTVFREMDEFLDWSWGDKKLGKPTLPAKPEEPKPEPKIAPHANAAAKAAAAARMAKARAAKGKNKAKAPGPAKASISPEVMQTEKSLQPEKFEDMVLEPDLTDAPEPEPEPEADDPVAEATKLTAIRVKTTEDLQAAYSSGKHKQVLDLLAKYGNGAKSFRELDIKDFLPIRKAIDEGALA